MNSADEYAKFARAHLTQSLAERWVSLLRPAVQFPYDLALGQPSALRLGGDPLLPDAVDWPVLDGYGPLSFIAELDCAAVAAVGGVDRLPTSGHLLFFCADFRYQDPDLDSSGVGSWAQGRVVYVAAGTPRHARHAPDGLVAYGAKHQPARAVSTPPPADRKYAERYFGVEVAALMDEDLRVLRSSGGFAFESVCPLWAGSFELGVRELRGGYSQTGGYSRSVQGPVELEAAYDALGGRTGVTDEQVLDEAQHWRVLLQTADDEEIDMFWAGGSVAYWMIRDDDLAARRFDRVWFTMQN